MKRKHTIRAERKKFGSIDSNENDDSSYLSEELEYEYEGRLWQFSPEDDIKERPSYPQASLLGLPVELRLQILQQLLPDEDDIKMRDLRRRKRPNKIIHSLHNARKGIWHYVSVKRRAEKLKAWTSAVEVDYSALRKDLESCHPAILRVNRQLYSEGAQILYNKKTFCAELILDYFRICSREFYVGFPPLDFGMLESQLRHVGELKIMIHARDDGCRLEEEDGHHCNEAVCYRKQVDGIRNLAEFLSECIGLHTLDINVESVEYLVASGRRPLNKKELRKQEADLLESLKPFASIRGLAWASFSINGDPPRSHRNSRAEFCNELEAMTKLMCSNASVAARTDLPLVKWAFQRIFTMNLEYRSVMRHRINLDVDDLAAKCWQACENGDKRKVLQHHKQLTKAWKEQKSVIEGLLRQIEEMTRDEGSN